MCKMESALDGISNKLCVVEERVVKLKVQSYNMCKRKQNEINGRKTEGWGECSVFKVLDSQVWGLEFISPGKAQALAHNCNPTAPVSRWEKTAGFLETHELLSWSSQQLNKIPCIKQGERQGPPQQGDLWHK